MPAWKLPLCVQALNARPIDLAHVAEVTEIQFASSDLVIVAARCLENAVEQSSTQHEEGKSSGTVSGKNQDDDSQQYLTSVPQHKIPLNSLPQP